MSKIDKDYQKVKAIIAKRSCRDVEVDGIRLSDEAARALLKGLRDNDLFRARSFSHGARQVIR